MHREITVYAESLGVRVCEGNGTLNSWRSGTREASAPFYTLTSGASGVGIKCSWHHSTMVFCLFSQFDLEFMLLAACQFAKENFLKTTFPLLR